MIIGLIAFGLVGGLVFALFMVRMIRKGMGLPVIFDGHLIKKWKEKWKKKHVDNDAPKV